MGLGTSNYCQWILFILFLHPQTCMWHTIKKYNPLYIVRAGSTYAELKMHILFRSLCHGKCCKAKPDSRRVWMLGQHETRSNNGKTLDKHSDLSILFLNAAVKTATPYFYELYIYIKKWHNKRQYIFIYIFKSNCWIAESDMLSLKYF